MNLEDYDQLAENQDEGLEVQLLDPVTAEPTTGIIRLVGPDTSLARASKSRAIKHVLSRKQAHEEWNEDDDFEVRIRTVAGCVVEWKGIHRGEAEFPFSFDNAMFFFRKYSWWLDQCDRKAADRRNFIQGSFEPPASTSDQGSTDTA